ncbi:MAG TPA: iron uptake transporter permease EfeU [Mycobacteriales bacterium]|nr:iron uptake transporter permease EfeU [Mycobacteriales bacterium]
MLPTFVIGLREGLEAALIVGIVAAFLRKRGQPHLLRWVLAGIAAAVTICAAAGIALELVSRDLPQRQQEGLETVIGAVAVAMVTYMVVWMRRHSRDLKGQLEGAAGAALATGSGWALVLMAFLAVFREGLETVVFLLAAFNETDGGGSAAIGASLGIVIAIGLGYAIYRGGVRLNLSRFFRATGVVLVLVAAGLVLTALHTAHEAGWLNVGQQRTVDLSGVVRPGSVQASLLTGVLGLQPRPVLIELVGWLVYLVPLLLYVAWPPGRPVRRPVLTRLALGAGAVAAVAAVVLVTVLPGRPAADPVTASGTLSAQVLSGDGGRATIRATVPADGSQAGMAAVTQELTATRTGSASLAGVAVDVYSIERSVPVTGRPATLSFADLATLNGGRLPLGLRRGAGAGQVPVRYSAAEVGTFWVATGTRRVVDVSWQRTVTVLAGSGAGQIPITGTPTTSRLNEQAAAEARAAAGTDRAAEHRRRLLGGWAWLAAVAATALLATGAALAWTARRSKRTTPESTPPRAITPAPEGVRLGSPK